MRWEPSWSRLRLIMVPGQAMQSGKGRSTNGRSLGKEKQTSYPDFVSSTGYGTGAGLGGWNCRHSYYPFFEGLSERAYEHLNTQETERVYELEQQRRYNERMIREWTRQQKTLEAGGYDASKEREKAKEWNRRNETLIKANPDVLKGIMQMKRLN